MDKNMNGPDHITPLTPEQVKQRRGRSLAIAWALVALALLFTVVTYIRLGDRMMQPHKPAQAGSKNSAVHAKAAGKMA